MKRLYSILILSLFVLPLLADNVSVERAQDIAQQFCSGPEHEEYFFAMGNGVEW